MKIYSFGPPRKPRNDTQIILGVNDFMFLRVFCGQNVFLFHCHGHF